MSRNKTTVAHLAEEASLELDEALVLLWDAGFHYLNGPRDVLPKREANRARRHLGLSTRREMASAQYWQELLELAPSDLAKHLILLGVPEPWDGTQLKKRAISRLRANARERNLWPPKFPTQELTPNVSSKEVASVPLEWEVLGHQRPLEYLLIEDVLRIHDALIEDFSQTDDPIEPPGVKSRSLLESAVSRPLTSMGSELKYPTVEMSAAALLHALVHNHPFHNGNKRTALVSMLVHLDENGMALKCAEDDLFKLVLQLAQHALYSGDRAELSNGEVLAVTRWLVGNCRWLEQGDRPLQWRRLRKILSRYECSLEQATGVGNRINIVRHVKKKGGWLKKDDVVPLQTQTSYAGEGQEVAKNTINKIRRDLQLDDQNGVDSRAFYDSEEMSTGGFIVRYRKILRRLAKL